MKKIDKDFFLLDPNSRAIIGWAFEVPADSKYVFQINGEKIK